jgi:Beta-propeller repeat/Dockerin type I domain
LFILSLEHYPFEGGFMKTVLVLVVLVILSTFVLVLGNQVDLDVQQMKLRPLSFTENQGQWDEEVKFKANAGGAAMWFTSDGVVFQFIKHIKRSDSKQDEPFDLLHDRYESEPDSIEQLVIKTSFAGANLNPVLSGEDMMEYKCNYFIGNDPNQWHTDVTNYQAVVFKEIYSGIDLKYYGNGKQMEYDFIISPGTDYSQIQIQYDGAKSLSVNSSGELVVETDWGNVIEKKPVVYQVDGNDRQIIEGKYNISDNNRFSFELDDNYNPNLPLVIDPILEYSTYLGGSNHDEGFGIAVDASGCAYVTGLTMSTDFPTEDPYQTIQGNDDVFVTKLSSTGNNLVYSTYLGGSGNFDTGYGIAVDASGCAYITGYTSSPDFPTVNSYQTDQGDTDVFVTKLSSTGNSLIYSTYLGGSGYEGADGIALDAAGCAYVTGYTVSTNFPTVNPYQTDPDAGLNDAFVTKFSSAGNSLIYSTYLGGSAHDHGLGIAVDDSECAYVTGYTPSTDFPSEDPYQTDQGDTDAFVTKLSSTGNSLIYSTYLGGSGQDYGYAIALDDSECAYLTGYTLSTDFPSEGPYQTDQGSTDAFVTKLSSTGNSLIYSTYLGGSGQDIGYGIAVDALGRGHITGLTDSPDFPTEDPFQSYQSNQNGPDAFVTLLSSVGNSLIYSTYLGGSDWDEGHGIAVDIFSCAYVTGVTFSPNFPSFNSYQTEQVDNDAFITKLCAEGPLICGDANYDGTVNVSDAVYIINYVFVGGNSPNPYASGDTNCDSICNVSDAVWIINYVFVGGFAPCDTDGDDIPDC